MCRTRTVYIQFFLFWVSWQLYLYGNVQVCPFCRTFFHFTSLPLPQHQHSSPLRASAQRKPKLVWFCWHGLFQLYLPWWWVTDLVCSNCTYPDDGLRTCFLVGGCVLVCGTHLRMWYVFAYRPICPCNRLLASAGIRPTKAKACLVLLAWFVPIVPTLLMGYGLVSWQVWPFVGNQLIICLSYVLVCGTYLRIRLSALARDSSPLQVSGQRKPKLAWFCWYGVFQL